MSTSTPCCYPRKSLYEGETPPPPPSPTYCTTVQPAVAAQTNQLVTRLAEDECVMEGGRDGGQTSGSLDTSLRPLFFGRGSHNALHHFHCDVSSLEVSTKRHRNSTQTLVDCLPVHVFFFRQPPLPQKLLLMCLSTAGSVI